MDFKQKQRLLQNNNTPWWDMNNYIDSGFTSQNVRKKMFDVDDPKDPETVEMWNTNIEKAIVTDAIERQRKIDEDLQKQVDERNERKERYSGFFGVFRMIGDGLTSIPKAVRIIDEAGVKTVTKEIVKDGVEEFADKVVDNPITNTVGDVFSFITSLFQNWYLYLIGFGAIIILIKKI